jgi:ech hydrogenase subunit D
MIAPPSINPVTPDTLVEQVRALRDQDYRLVQIGATAAAEGTELTYTFDRDLQMIHLRFRVPASAARIPSITAVFWAAFVYENELHDLFGIQIDGLALSYKGKFYNTSVPFPFACTTGAAPEKAPAS